MLGIFDVYANPDAVHSLVLANAMSDRLWELSAKASTSEVLWDRLISYQRLIDKYFTHLSPAEVAQRNGVLDLDAESERLGADVIDAALKNIVSTLIWRQQRGTVTNIDSTLELIDRRKFPAFTYGTVDTLHHNLLATGKKSSRAIGLSSCLDEAALFSALVMTGSVSEISGIVILGSASHYTVFGWSGEPGTPSFDAWWFYGKNMLYRLADYHDVIAQDYAGDAALAFADRLPGMDTVIAREGSWRFGQSTTSLGTERISELSTALDHFFGFRLTELESALTPAPRSEQLFEQCLECTSADQVRSIVNTADRAGGSGAGLARFTKELA
jgi:hypothetical protein